MMWAAGTGSHDETLPALLYSPQIGIQVDKGATKHREFSESNTKTIEHFIKG